MYKIGVSAVLIQVVEFLLPLGVIVLSGFTVMVPVVVELAQLPTVTSVYVKVPDCVAVPLIIYWYAVALYVPVIPGGKLPDNL